MVVKNLAVRIFLLDRHTLTRAGIRSLLDKKDNFEVIGEAGDLDNGLKGIIEQKPDIILVDLNLDERESSYIIEQIVKVSDQARIVLISESNDSNTIQKAVETGVSGVVLKSQSPDVLIKAIEKVNAGEVWLERSVIATVLSRLSRNGKSSNKSIERDKIEELSGREKEIIGLIGLGYKNKRISTQLCISETTVRHHLTSIYNKLGVSDRLELLVYAHRFGLVKFHN